MRVERKVRILFLVLIPVYALLVATHQGEFWPFSIFPMFSQAGKTWDHAIVYSNINHAFQTGSPDEKPQGSIVKLDHLPIIQNDLSGLMRQVNKKGTAKAVENMRIAFSSVIKIRPIMIYNVKGSLTGVHGEKVLITYHPLIYMNRDTTIVYHP